MTDPVRAEAPGVTAAALERDEAAWEAFLAASPAPSHLQSAGWAAVKRPNGWRAFRAAAGADDRLVGAQVLVQRPRGVPWGMGYLARGPVTADGRLDRARLAALTERLRALAPANHVGFVRMEPEAEADPALERELIRAGWRRAPHVQPERTLIIDLAQDEAAILAGMHRKTRQSVTKSERLGVRVVDADGARLDEFYAIHAGAMERAGIAARAERTYRDMWEHLAPRGMARLLFAEATDTGEAVATLFLVSCGRRVADLYGGTTEEGGRRRANYLLKWEAIRRCKAAGFAEYDLWGLPKAGIEQFKSGFGGREIEYVGAWELTISTLGKGVLDAGVAARERFRRWRYRDIHNPDDPHGRGAAATADAVASPGDTATPVAGTAAPADPD
ncbi:MAG: peptidoglycan bridge formation glycyltransferase FemA/FemB family protein [Chloroflexota bacterium]